MKRLLPARSPTRARIASEDADTVDILSDHVFSGDTGPYDEASPTELASYLARRYARLDVHHRRDRRAPHLGRVELTIRYSDALARPLPSVIPDEPRDLEARWRSSNAGRAVM